MSREAGRTEDGSRSLACRELKEQGESQGEASDLDAIEWAVVLFTAAPAWVAAL